AFGRGFRNASQGIGAQRDLGDHRLGCAGELRRRDAGHLDADRRGLAPQESAVVTVKLNVPATDAATTQAVAEALRRHAAPLTSAQARQEDRDLAAFGKAVGNSRIVSLGEATHGSREFFQMKHRLLEYLVREKGFTVFAIEANWPESLAV